MELRKATLLDAKRIMAILDQAKASLKENGVDQWQDEYPNMDTIVDDIEAGYAYVGIVDEIIAVTVAVSFDAEDSYTNIEGQWKSDGEYAVIHRMAIDNGYKGKGVSTSIINYVVEMCKERNIHSIKIDTDKDNIPMQKLLEKTGFEYCGTVLFDCSEKIAFEKQF